MIFARGFCVFLPYGKIGEKGISAAPVDTGEKPRVETVRGEIANPAYLSSTGLLSVLLFSTLCSHREYTLIDMTA